MKNPLIVIGGGPAGMMAAGRAAELGTRVILLEKNDSLGKKLLITGGGRCNVTNGETDLRVFLSKYKDGSKYLFSLIDQWNTEDTRNFFHQKGMPTKVENEKRVFPTSDQAQSVWDVLVQYLKDGKVEVVSNCAVQEIKKSDEGFTVECESGRSFTSSIVILATGGTSRPETGSTGDAYPWLQKLGHTVNAPNPSLVPISTKTDWVPTLAGIALPEVKITTLQNNVKQQMSVGKLLFTHTGLSGPGILNMSKDIGELLKYGEVTIALDLLHKLDHGQLNSKLQEILQGKPRAQVKNILTEIIPTGLTLPVLNQANILADKKGNEVSREERMRLIQSLKNLTIEVEGLLGTDKAIITSGGVHLDEVDFKTMESKIHPGLYLIGDLLDIDRPSGGYSLQLCWSTGFVAGTNAAKKALPANE